MFISVQIGDKDMFEDFGCILATKTIGMPKVQKKMVSVPLRDGAIDMTEALLNDVKYENRPINMSFLYMGEDLAIEIGKLQHYLHGQRLKVIFGDDSAYFYIGRVEIDSWRTKKDAGILALTVDADPYKYDVQGTADDWLWDPFDFEEGYISGGSIVPVEGEEIIYVYGRRKYTYPTIRCSAPMELEFLGTKYQLPAGLTKAYDVMIRQGENKLIFRGHGDVTVDYRGGEL